MGRKSGHSSFFKSSPRRPAAGVNPTVEEDEEDEFEAALKERMAMTGRVGIDRESLFQKMRSREEAQQEEEEEEEEEEKIKVASGRGRRGESSMRSVEEAMRAKWDAQKDNVTTRMTEEARDLAEAALARNGEGSNTELRDWYLEFAAAIVQPSTKRSQNKGRTSRLEKRRGKFTPRERLLLTDLSPPEEYPTAVPTEFSPERAKDYEGLRSKYDDMTTKESVGASGRGGKRRSVLRETVREGYYYTQGVASSCPEALEQLPYKPRRGSPPGDDNQ